MRRNMLIVAGCALLMFAALYALLAARADAAYPPPPEGYGAAEVAIAREYWGTDPALCATQEITFDAAPTDNPGAWGEATIATEPGPCIMRIAPALGVLNQCLTVVHEFGHWLGLQHSAYRASIMYPGIISGNQNIPACWALAHKKFSASNMSHHRA